jgi:hypothetical protein
VACINPDGSLSVVAKAVLSRLATPMTVPALAEATGLPVYRIRATIRETGRARLIAAAADDADSRDGPWLLTDLGQEALTLDEEGA